VVVPVAQELILVVYPINLLHISEMKVSECC
jgi:hypothetical protein